MVLTRRTFISASLASGVAIGVGGAFSVSPAQALAQQTVIHSVVYDQRHPASLQFAATVQRLGIKAEAIQGDVTRLWQESLHDLWRGGPALVGGMTSARSAFCLDQMARQFGHRIVLRVDHLAQEGGGVIHHAPWGVAPPALASDDALWPEVMAEMVLLKGADQDALSPVPILRAPNLAQDGLISWVIGPLNRA